MTGPPISTPREHLHPEHVHGQSPRAGRAFALATALNVIFVAVEIVAGVLSGSMALLADAAHNFTDVLGLVLAWLANVLARREPTTRHTYGLGKTTILAALANAVLLLVTVGGVAWEAVRRIGEPHPVDATTVVWVAAVGVIVNGIAAALFIRGRDDVNIRAAAAHLLADAAVSAGVVVVGLLLMWTGLAWLDPLLSLLIAAVILGTAVRLLREALELSTDAVPRGIDLDDVRSFLADQPGVRDVHDIHVWAMSSTENAMTAHIVVEPGVPHGPLLRAIHTAMLEEYAICHCTVQIEPSTAEAPQVGTSQ